MWQQNVLFVTSFGGSVTVMFILVTALFYMGGVLVKALRY